MPWERSSSRWLDACGDALAAQLEHAVDGRRRRSGVDVLPAEQPLVEGRGAVEIGGGALHPAERPRWVLGSLGHRPRHATALAPLPRARAGAAVRRRLRATWAASCLLAAGSDPHGQSEAAEPAAARELHRERRARARGGGLRARLQDVRRCARAPAGRHDDVAGLLAGDVEVDDVAQRDLAPLGVGAARGSHAARRACTASTRAVLPHDGNSTSTVYRSRSLRTTVQLVSTWKGVNLWVVPTRPPRARRSGRAR